MKGAAWIAAVLSLSLLAPSRAEASSCSGGGGDGGSSSSSDSSSSDSSSSDWSSSDSSSSSRPPCLAAHDPVGLRDCGAFGAWSTPTRLPRFIIGLGVAMRQAPSSVGGKTGHVTHENEGFSYRTVDGGGGGGGGAAAETAVLSTFRIGVGLPKPFYAAVDLEFGGIASSGPTAEMTSSGMRGAPTISRSTAFAFNTAGVVGARTGWGRSSLALEVAGGMRAVNYAFQSNYLACETFTNIRTVDPLVEIRASAERWLNPWVSVGAVAGGSVIERGAWMTGLYLGFHTRAFAGER